MSEVIDHDAEGSPIRARDRVRILRSNKAHRHLEGRVVEVIGDATAYSFGYGAWVGLDAPYGDGRRVAMRGRHLLKIAGPELVSWDGLREEIFGESTV